MVDDVNKRWGYMAGGINEPLVDQGFAERVFTGIVTELCPYWEVWSERAT